MVCLIVEENSVEHLTILLHDAHDHGAFKAGDAPFPFMVKSHSAEAAERLNRTVGVSLF